MLVAGLLFVLFTQVERGPRQTRRAVVGLEAPAFVLLDGEGAAVRLSDFRGKTVFLHFWASWCKNCREEMPFIQDLYERKKSDPDFVLISVVYREDPAETLRFMEANGYDIPLYTDPGEEAARAYGVTGVPETFVIGADGILKKRVIGPGNWNEL